jgi:hypothetical protein
VTRAVGRAASTLSFLLLLSSAPVLGQIPQSRDPMARLQPNVRYRIELLIDSARIYGVPTGPLQSKALEGAAKRADGRAIVLEVGIPQTELAALARSREEKVLTVPLVVLTDLVTRGVPRDTASVTIFQLFQRGAEDGDFLGLWRGVERDIDSGTDPGQALLNRAREIPSRGPPPVSPPASTGRPESSETPDR